MRTVSFKAKDKSKGGIPEQKNANQIAMAAGKDAEERDQDEFQEVPLYSKEDVDEQFPTAAHQDSKPGDKLLAMKAELGAANEAAQKAADPNKKPLPGVTPLGVMMAKDSDFQRLIEIREKELELRFEQWFASNFDKMDPAHKAMARDTYAKFYNDRLRNLDTNLEQTRRLARLAITGPETKEDLYLMYAKDAGLIDTAYLDNLLHPEKVRENQDKIDRQTNFRRGLFSPKRFLRGASDKFRSGNSADANNRSFAAPASLFGVDGEPFSAMGNVTAVEEKKTNFQGTLGMLDTGTD